MPHQSNLIPPYFHRVEKDDRLFDILPKSETREKGVELWEKWTEDQVEFLRYRLGQSAPTRHSLDRKKIENALRNDKKLTL